MWRRELPTVILAAVLLGGCSEDVVVPYQPAPAPSGPLPLVKAANDRLRPEDWPRACDLLTETDIRAILPSTTRVDSKPANAKFFASGGQFPYNFVVPDAKCVHDVYFPGIDGSTRGALVRVEVSFAGSTEAARHNWDEVVEDPGSQPCTADFPGMGVDDCVRTITEQYHLLKNGVSVEIGSTPPIMDEGNRLAGQTEEGAASSGWDVDRVWKAEVVPLFIPPVLARLP